MTRERIKRKYNVDVDKVKFNIKKIGEHTVGVSREINDADRHYIQMVNDDYEVVCGKTNTVSHWICDLSELEER